MIQLGIIDSEVNTRLEGGIERRHPIRCQEHHAFIVFKQSEEDTDELVAMNIRQRSLLEEHVALQSRQSCDKLDRDQTYLVQQEHRIPLCRNLKHLLEILLYFGSISAKFACTHRVQRALHLLRDSLSCQGLAHARLTRQQHDNALSLACNYVIEIVFVGKLAFGKSQN